MAKKLTVRNSTIKRNRKPKAKNRIKKFASSHQRVLILLAFILVFGVIGSIALYIAFAGNTKTANVEAETFRVNSHVERIASASASGGQAMRLRSNTSLSKSITLPQSTVQFIVRARGLQCNGAPRAVIKVDGNTVASHSVSSKLWANYKTDRTLGSGSHTLTISFTNNYNQYRGGKRVCTRDLDIDKITFYSQTPDEPSPSGAVPCALTDAAESCWAANTGPIDPNGGRYSKAEILAGQSNLKKVTSQATAPAGTTYNSGKLSVTQEGAVLDRIWLEGCIAIKAKNVTISNSLINNVNHLTCSGGNAQALASTINNGGCVGANGDGPGAMTGMVITDTEVDVNNASFDTSAISNGNYYMSHVNFHGANVGAWASCNAVIEDSYGHGLSNAAGGIHEDVIDADSSNNVTAHHNWLSGVGGNAVTGAMVFNGTWGAAEYGTVTNNFLQGGNGADARFVENQHHMVVKDNAFSNNNGYGGTTYVYGWNPNQPGMVWSGNYVPETGKTVNSNGTVQ